MDEVSSRGSNANDVARLEALTQRKHAIWEELGNTRDEELRAGLFDELDANRKERDRLHGIINRQDEPGTAPMPVAPAPEPPTSIGETLRSNLLLPPEGDSPTPPVERPSNREHTPLVSHEARDDSVAPEPVVTQRADTGAVADTSAPPTPESTPSRNHEDEAVAARSPRQAEVAVAAEPASAEAKTPAGLDELRRAAHRTYQGSRVRLGGDRRIPLFVFLGATAAVVLVAFVWLLFLRPSGSEEVAAPTTTTVAADVEAPVIDQIRAVLEGLGYGSITVEERSGTVYLAGLVGSDNDHASAISASQALAGSMPLDSSALTVDVAPPTTVPSTTSPPETGGETEEPAVDPTVVDGPHIEASLTGKDFVLAGVVPSAALASSYLRSAEIAYSPYVRSELVVDEQLEPVDWLERGPDAIVMLPLFIDGKILIADGQVQISGRSPDQAGVDRLQGALGQITGLPVVLGNVEVANLEPPSWVLAADAGVLELGGELPSEEIRDMLLEGAVAAYGPGNVQDAMTVNANVYPSLWMYSGGPLLQAMTTFPDFALRIDGTAFSGFINGGVTFESASATFSGNYAQVLDVGVSVLTRDRSLFLVIEGHTDNRGSPESNLALSQARAEAVRDYFIANGIDPSRLTAVGIGEAEPVVSNDTAAGRARNRRIQYVLSTGS